MDDDPDLNRCKCHNKIMNNIPLLCCHCEFHIVVRSYFYQNAINRCKTQILNYPVFHRNSNPWASMTTVSKKIYIFGNFDRSLLNDHIYI